MRKLEIRLAKNFLTVAREKNFTHAAEILHISQPSLSKQIKELEEEFGKKLFVRQSSGIKLTDAGILLKNRAENLVELSEKIDTEFKNSEMSGGEIFFGLAESYQIKYLARAIKNLQKNYPDLKFNITSGDTEQIIDKLDSGILDFVVLAENPDFHKYNFLKFPESDIWGLIIPIDDKLSEKNFIKFEDLTGKNLFCSGQAWRKEISEWCGGKIEKLNLAGSFKLSYNGAIFVQENLGYLLTFDKLINFKNLVFRPLYPKCETKLYLVWKKYPKFSPVSEKFLEEIKILFSESKSQKIDNHPA